MLTSELFEKRSNPDRNKKEYALVSLEKYRGQKDIFVSFTADVGMDSLPDKERNRRRSNNASGFKLGLNPRNEYNTPTGIYTYPVDYVLEHNLKVPFGHSRPFIVVARLNTRKVIEIGQATEADLDHVINILMDKYKADREELDLYMEGSRFKTPGSALWYISMLVAKNTGDDKIDDAFNLAHPYDFPEKPSPEEGEEALSEWQEQVREIYRVRHREKQLYLKNVNIGGKRGAIWNRMLRECGYECIIDNGAGIIHPNEPHQAVFLTGTSLKLVEVIQNKKELSYSSTSYLSDNPDVAVREIIRGNMRFEDIMKIASYTPSIFPKIINHIAKKDAMKMLQAHPELFQTKLPEWTHNFYASLPASFDPILSPVIEKEAIFKRIQNHPSFWRHINGYNGIRFEYLDPITQRVVAEHYPRELTMVDNYSRIDKEAFRIAMSLLEKPQQDHVKKWAAK